LKRLKCPQPELINALRSIGNPICLDAADWLEKMAGSSRAGDLHLRLTGFNQTDARILARGMQDAVAGNALV